jgi:hypothetical protein
VLETGFQEVNSIQSLTSYVSFKFALSNMELPSEYHHLKMILDIFVSMIGFDKWNLRKEPIIEYLTNLMGLSPERKSLTDESNRLTFKKDKFAWYLFLVESYLTASPYYEFTQGARVIPIFAKIGMEFEYLLKVTGIEKRLYRLTEVKDNQPDGGLFELLVAITYAKNSENKVEFIEEIASKKNPDLCVINNGNRFFVECKRLSKSSEYSKSERKHWLTMWDPVAKYLGRSKLPVLLDIRFHKQLVDYDPMFMEKKLIPKLSKSISNETLFDNEEWTVAAELLSMDQINHKLSLVNARHPSRGLNEIIAGRDDLERGITAIFGTNRSSENIKYIKSLDFAACAFWSTDSQEAADAKARNVKKRISEACRQIPEGESGIVHVGLESHDGITVEQIRAAKIFSSIMNFNPFGKNLQWIYIHIFDPRDPVDKAWDFGETIHPFSISGCPDEIIDNRFLVVPDQ